MRLSAFETGSCSEDEKRFSLTVHKLHPAVKIRKKVITSFFISEAEKKGSFFMNRKKQEETLFTLVCLALLIAIQVVLARFAVIPLMGGNLRFSISFIPVVIAARCFGILPAMAVYGLGDFIGAIAFPTTGAYFPGFTVTAVISGFIFGAFLSKKASLPRIIGSVVSSQIFCSLLLNSFWLWWLSKNGTLEGYLTMAGTRVPQCIITGAIQIVFMALFLEKISKVIKIPKRG